MNILIPHSWLLEHLETDATPLEIQRYLSLCGPSVERIYQKEGEAVYDIEVTTNRVDCMSVRGIAREAAAILPQFQLAAHLKPLALPEWQSHPRATQLLPFPKVINNPALCHRTMGIVLSQLKKTPTPELMAQRLRQIDQNVHDSMIDITNYITHELGHPCHAFDYDKVMALGGEIRVVEAKPGQSFTTLDGVSYETKGGEVVFVNNLDEIIDLPAIKGTSNTSINESTTNVLLWVESLDAKKVRFGSMTHAIRTVAAQLNEKNPDPELGLSVLAQGVELYTQLCQAQVASELYDDFPGKRQPGQIAVSDQQIQAYLGVELNSSVIKKMLEALECQVMVETNLPNQGHGYVVTPPSFRPDLVLWVDVIEEIARIYGYHNVPSQIMPTAIPTSRPQDTNFALEQLIKQLLSDLGWQELFTYSMVSAELATQSGYELATHLKLQNPLTDDKVYLRRSLIPSLEEVLNQNPLRPQLSVFEIANLYHPVTDGLPANDTYLAFVSPQSYRQVRGVLEVLLDKLFIKNWQIQPLAAAPAPYTQAAQIVTQDHSSAANELGVIGILPNGRVAAQLLLKKLVAAMNTHPTYQPLPKAAAIVEDLTFTLPAKTAIGPILAAAQQVDAYITKVELKAVYQQNYTLTLTYLDPNQPISDHQVAPLRKKVVTLIESQFGATLVGTV